MRTIKYERDPLAPPPTENPFKVCNIKTIKLSMGYTTMVDTGLRFDDEVEIRLVDSCVEAVAVLGVYRRGGAVWLAATLYDRIDGMSLESGCPLARLEVVIGQHEADTVRFLDFTGGKRGAICGQITPVSAQTPNT